MLFILEKKKWRTFEECVQAVDAVRRVSQAECVQGSFDRNIRHEEAQRGAQEAHKAVQSADVGQLVAASH